MNEKYKHLLTPYQMGPIELNNRIVMAPMTRCMAGDGLIPTKKIAQYYKERADAGLIITEGSIVRPDGQGYPDTPGIYNNKQVEGWKMVTESVHQAGGKIFLQIWHVGRVSHPSYLDGAKPVAPSAVSMEGPVRRRKDMQYGTPRELSTEEIPEYVESYGKGAKNAKLAGFDGVEIHGANGYLIDQFLHHHTNRREDSWGGSKENMARFCPRSCKSSHI